MNLVTLLDVLMVEITKLNGKPNQAVNVYVEPPFVDILWEYVDDAVMKGCDTKHDGTEIKWVTIGTQFGCFKFMNKEGRHEVPAKGIQGVEKKAEQDGEGKQAPEPSEVEDWKDQIGGPGS